MSPGRWKLCPSVKSSVAASLDRVHRLLVKEESTWPLPSAFIKIKVYGKQLRKNAAWLIKRHL